MDHLAMLTPYEQLVETVLKIIQWTFHQGFMEVSVGSLKIPCVSPVVHVDHVDIHLSRASIKWNAGKRPWNCSRATNKPRHLATSCGHDNRFVELSVCCVSIAAKLFRQRNPRGALNPWKVTVHCLCSKVPISRLHCARHLRRPCQCTTGSDSHHGLLPLVCPLQSLLRKIGKCDSRDIFMGEGALFLKKHS